MIPRFYGRICLKYALVSEGKVYLPLTNIGDANVVGYSHCGDHIMIRNCTNLG